MRVNITYSVELDELVYKVHSLLGDVSRKLEGVSHDYAKLVKEFDGERLSADIEDIDVYRQRLATIDSNLADYCAILAGYQKTKAELYLAEQEKEQQESGEISEEAQKLIEQIEENENDNTDGNLQG